MKSTQFLLFMFVIITFTAINGQCAFVDCSGSWVVQEHIEDGWGYENTWQGVINRGFSMSFWIQPVFCEDEVEVGNFKYIYTKRVACVPPQLAQLVYSPVGGSCTVDTSNAIPQGVLPNDDPCYHFGGMYHTDYGEVTIAHTYKKFLWVCPQNSQPDYQKGQGPPCP